MITIGVKFYKILRKKKVFITKITMIILSKTLIGMAIGSKVNYRTIFAMLP
mgnify:CR=1 FL=1